ncbi:hypothetical protein TRVA0_008S00936 [Trichomonascus vanleenenianus]|uniref:exosome non-catalytic core subunit MTR3 n=1 Tax=Trichomonascus vanleenenianus TaxID=2268995 RepID=UPI003ECA8726
MSVLQDRRRVLGPTDSVPLQIESDVERVREAERSRGNEELRKLFIRQGTIANANGSAYLEVGDDIQIQVSVSGPKPIRGSFTTTAELSVEFRYSPFVTSDRDQDDVAAEEKNMAAFLHTALVPSVMLDNYPKSAISVLVTVLCARNGGDKLADKALLAAACNAASVALADSGIALRDMVTAGAVRVDESGGPEVRYLHDPETVVDNDRDVDAVVAYMCAAQTITATWFEGGRLSPSVVDGVLKHTKTMAASVRALINGLLVQEFKHKEANV